MGKTRVTGPMYSDNGFVGNVVGNVTGNTTGTSTGSVASVGTIGFSPQIAMATGSNSQSGSAPVTASMVIVTTVTASSRGLILGAAATGRSVFVLNVGAHIVRVYPGTNGKITSSSTNVATTVAVGKGELFVAYNTTQWAVLGVTGV